MTALPEWIEQRRGDCIDPHKLIDALTIAWEALDKDLNSWKSIKGARQGAEEAMRRIEEMGE